mgnify:FL=1
MDSQELRNKEIEERIAKRLYDKQRLKEWRESHKEHLQQYERERYLKKKEQSGTL